MYGIRFVEVTENKTRIERVKTFASYNEWDCWVTKLLDSGRVRVPRKQLQITLTQFQAWPENL